MILITKIPAKTLEERLLGHLLTILPDLAAPPAEFKRQQERFDTFVANVSQGSTPTKAK